MKRPLPPQGSNAGTRKVGLYVKKDARAAGKAEEFADWLKARKVEVILKISPGSLDRGSGSGPAQPPENLLCVFVLGGDGTFLSAVRWIGDREIPLLGVKFGDLGFLAEIAEENLFEAAERVLNGDFRISPRMRLDVQGSYLLIFSLLILIAALTWIIPGGEYERTTMNGREVVVQNSFKYIENEPQGIFAIFIAPLKGFVEAGMIIGFILLVGGAFNVLAKTHAINSLINKLAKAHRNSTTLRKLFVPVLILMFSIGGATFGINEEIIPFVLIIVPICLALGYDSIVGVAIPLVGAHIGFASAFLNPFNVGIAQGIADV